MNRVLNVIIISGLACTLACAPGSRHQTGTAQSKQAAKPSTPPAGAPGPQDLNPAKATAPITPTKGFDPGSAALINAGAFPNIPEGGMTLVFTTVDSKKLTQEAKIVVDGNSDITNADSTLSATYNCEDTDSKKTPATCTDGVFTFTWNKLSGQAEVKVTTGLKVTEAIDKTPATKQFGTGVVLNLSFTLNSVAFKRTSAAIVSADISADKTKAASANYDDKQTGTGAEAATTIEVFGLPKVSLDGTTPITPTETLSAKPEAPARVSSGAVLTSSTSTEKQLIYTLGIQNQNDAKSVQSLTLTISIPLTDEDKADASSDAEKAAAAAAKTKADSDAAAATAAGAGKTTTDATKSGASTTTGGTAAASGDADGAPHSESDALKAAAGGANPNPVANTATTGKPAAKPAVKPPEQTQAQLDAKTKAAALQAASEQAQKDAATLATTQAALRAAADQAAALQSAKSCVYNSAIITKSKSFGWDSVQQNVDFVNGNASIVLTGPMYKDGWRNNYCDSSTGRIAVDSKAPGAVPCVAKVRTPNDGVDHDETIIFRSTGGASEDLCGATVYHYVPGAYNVVDGKRECVVNSLDGVKMTGAFDPESDGHNAHYSLRISPLTHPMTDMAGTPGMYQHVGLNNTRFDLFNQPDGTQSIFQCWGRVSRDFTSTASK
jgi:hypothetical protein